MNDARSAPLGHGHARWRCRLAGRPQVESNGSAAVPLVVAPADRERNVKESTRLRLCPLQA